MTAHWARLLYEFLDRLSRRIVNELAGISHVSSTTSPASRPRYPSDNRSHGPDHSQGRPLVRNEVKS